jgi:hypothetical protein
VVVPRAAGPAACPSPGDAAEVRPSTLSSR